MKKAFTLPCNVELILDGGCSVYACLWVQMVTSQGRLLTVEL